VADALERIGEEAVRDAFQADAMGWLNRKPLVSSEVEKRPARSERFSTSLEANGEN
jgi:hypothetical protein